MISLRTLALAAAVGAAPLAAQYGYDLDKASPGTLGQPLLLEFRGAAPGKLLLFMLSGNAGPTPLALVQPGDPRVLEVGLDLAFAWSTVPTGTGAGTLALPVPVLPGLHGADLHLQTLTAPGATAIVDQLGNPVVAQLGLAGDDTTLAAALTAARALSAVFADRDNDGGRGDVVVAGGGQGSLLGARGLATSELVGFRRLDVRAGPSMTAARALCTATVLRDGRVLLAGGLDHAGGVLRSAELYDPAADRFVATGAMGLARAAHAAALLPDGRVLVAGGTTTLADPIAALSNAQSSAEVFDPATGTWSGTAGMPRRLLAPALTALADGRVLLSGGFQVNVVFGIPLPVGSVAACSTFRNGAWSATGAMRVDRAAHAFNTVRLPDGRVLATGGARSGPDLTQATATAATEVFDPAAGAWTRLADLRRPTAAHTATVMPSGDVVLAGGAGGLLTAPAPHSDVTAFDPATSAFSPLPALDAPRAGHGAAVLPDGALLLIGGSDAAATLASIAVLRR